MDDIMLTFIILYVSLKFKIKQKLQTSFPNEHKILSKILAN